MIATAFGLLLVYTKRQNCKGFYQRPRALEIRRASLERLVGLPDQCGPLGSATPQQGRARMVA